MKTLEQLSKDKKRLALAIQNLLLQFEEKYEAGYVHSINIERVTDNTLMSFNEIDNININILL